MPDAGARSVWRIGRLAFVAVLVALAACRGAPEKEIPHVERRPIAQVLAEHTPALMALPGVAGVYQGALPDRTPCIKVIVVDRSAARRLPARLDGYPVVIEESDEIRAMPDTSD